MGPIFVFKASSGLTLEESIISSIFYCCYGSIEQMAEITHLFFVDDTLVFCELDEVALLNLRCVLLCLQAISDLNTNLTKFELVRLDDGNDATRLANILCYKIVELAIKKTGLSLGLIIKS